MCENLKYPFIDLKYPFYYLLMQNAHGRMVFVNVIIQ